MSPCMSCSRQRRTPRLHFGQPGRFIGDRAKTAGQSIQQGENQIAHRYRADLPEPPLPDDTLDVASFDVKLLILFRAETPDAPRPVRGHSPLAHFEAKPHRQPETMGHGAASASC